MSLFQNQFIVTNLHHQAGRTQCRLENGLTDRLVQKPFNAHRPRKKSLLKVQVNQVRRTAVEVQELAWIHNRQASNPEIRQTVHWENRPEAEVHKSRQPSVLVGGDRVR